MRVRKSTERDFQRMMQIYVYAREQMVKTGNPNQWGPTNGDNKVMQRLLEKLGFTHCGTIYVEEDDYPRLAFEKTDLTQKNDKPL